MKQPDNNSPVYWILAIMLLASMFYAAQIFNWIQKVQHVIATCQ